MFKIGFWGIIVTILALLTLLGLLYYMGIRKLLRSKIPEGKKILWIVLIILFQFMGLIAFIIYHDAFLGQELRAD
jgi:hypothetical protein